jgi:hypothetical protein
VVLFAALEYIMFLLFNQYGHPWKEILTAAIKVENKLLNLPRPIGAAYLKVGEVRDGVDSDLAGWGRGGLSYRGRPGRTI